jgi:hypothetical protein
MDLGAWVVNLIQRLKSWVMGTSTTLEKTPRLVEPITSCSWCENELTKSEQTKMNEQQTEVPMQDYMQRKETAEIWRRSYEVRLQNPLEGKGPRRIIFDEQDIIELGGETIIRNFNPGKFPAEITFEVGQSFPLIHPATQEPLGKSMSHEEFYMIVFSMYMHAAKMRDAAQLAANPVEPPVVEPGVSP